MSQDVDELANLLASKFIQRRDVKAVQKTELYMPVTRTGKPDGERIPWSRDDLRAHIEGRASYGHYLLDSEDQCKLLAFDIDLSKPNPQMPRKFQWIGIEPDGHYTDMEPKDLDPRASWYHPKAPDNLRRFLTAQMKEAATLLATLTVELLEIPVAVAYSGNKGMHVYGFTGTMPAADVRAMGQGVIEYADCFVPLRGKNFFMHESDDPRSGLGCIDVEVFPKQDSLNGKDLGNLMRLPLGINAKSGQEAFFVTLNSDVDELGRTDALRALEGGNPWM